MIVRVTVIIVMQRLLLLVALMVWQGGFMFYGAVVVPVGSEVLGSHLEQGFVTQSVTNYLNVAGAVALALWCWDITTGRAAGVRRLRWIGWGFLLVLLGVLVWLHPRLDALLNADGFRILDRPSYRLLHQWYLAVSTIQWIVAILLVGLTIWAWKESDAASRESIRQ